MLRGGGGEEGGGGGGGGSGRGSFVIETLLLCEGHAWSVQ